jgi:hypothetical protein
MPFLLLYYKIYILCYNYILCYYYKISRIFKKKFVTTLKNRTLHEKINLLHNKILEQFEVHLNLIVNLIRQQEAKSTSKFHNMYAFVLS